MPLRHACQGRSVVAVILLVTAHGENIHRVTLDSASRGMNVGHAKNCRREPKRQEAIRGQEARDRRGR